TDRSQARKFYTTHITNDERYLVVNAQSPVDHTSLYAIDLRNNSIKTLIERKEGTFEYIGQSGNQILLLTNWDAPFKRIISYNLNAKLPTARIVVREAKKVLQTARHFGNYTLAAYSEEGNLELVLFDGSFRMVHNIDLPEVGHVEDITFDATVEHAYFKYSGLISPPKIHELDLKTGRLNTFSLPIVPFSEGQYSMRKTYFRSLDGEQVPMFLLSKRNLAPTEESPVLLVASGSQNEALHLKYNATGLHLIPLFLENDGMVAIPMIRGNDQLGDYWFKNGSRINRQRGLDDFEAAATYLIQQRFTSVEKLAVYGHGPVGSMISLAGMVQRPDLYKVVVGRNGIYDIMNYHKYGNDWKYGTEIGLGIVAKEFDPLLSIAPMRHAIQTDYPAVLLCTALSGNEVSPIHTAKLIANIQQKKENKVPVLMRVPMTDNQSKSSFLTAETAEGADIMAFIFYQLKMSISSVSKNDELG
ncbi:MAG: prolyl oligopeptidase family serine peptidase, partial [Bacteroidota bacterium]